MSETNQELTRQYNSRTHAAIHELSAQLESFRNGTRSQDEIEKAAAEIARLRKEYADAIAFLPPYDQRQVDKQLKDLEADVEQLRASAVPRSKFAFKRKAGKVPTPSVAVPPSPPVASDVESQAQSSKLRSEPASSGLAIAGHHRKYLTLSALSSWSAASSDLTISDLDRCVVNLLAHDGAYPTIPTFTALHARNLSNTVLVLPVVEGSALLHDMTNCVIVLGSRQFRMHTSSHVDVYISISSNPIIEHCSSIRFADYPSFLGSSSGTGRTGDPAQSVVSNYLAVQDFSHIRATPSPNWSALPQDAKAVLIEDKWPAICAGAFEDVLKDVLPSS